MILLGFLLFCLTCLTEFSTCPVDTFLIWSFFGPHLETIEIQVLAINMQGRHWQGRNSWSDQNSSPYLFTKKEGSPLSNISYDDIWWWYMIYLMLESLYYIPARTWQNTNSYQTLNTSTQLKTVDKWLSMNSLNLPRLLQLLEPQHVHPCGMWNEME